MCRSQTMLFRKRWHSRVFPMIFVLGLIVLLKQASHNPLRHSNSTHQDPRQVNARDGGRGYEQTRLLKLDGSVSSSAPVHEDGLTKSSRNSRNTLDVTVKLEQRLLHVDRERLDKLDNETGADHFIVPNIVHFIRYNQTEYSFVDYVVLRAVMRNHRPDDIFIHTDQPETSLGGKYWDLIRKDRELWSRISLKPIQAPTEVFGQPLNPKWRFHHGSDLGRIQVLMKYGGIYIDNDVYVIRNLDKYRKYEITMNWDDNAQMGTQVIIAHKNARFLARWLDCYRVYRSDLWSDLRRLSQYYNAGERPTKRVLKKQPELLHRVKGWFGSEVHVSMRIYTDVGFNWRRLDAIHLLLNHRSYMDPLYELTPVFDEISIQTYKYPFGEMVRDVLDDSPGIYPAFPMATRPNETNSFDL